MFETLPMIVAGTKTVIGLAKDATGIAKDIKGLGDKPGDLSNEAKAMISELLDRLIMLQTEIYALQGTVGELEEEKRRVGQFQAEAVRYRLAATEQGSLVYELDPAHADGQPTHCICATCYDKMIKSVLQPVAYNTLQCGSCGTKAFRPDGRGIGVMIQRSSRGDFRL